MSLTDRALKSVLNKLSDKECWLQDRDGLAVRVSKKGKLTWTFRYRHAGRPKLFKVGRYPDISLADARDIVANLRKELAQGIDPSVSFKTNLVHNEQKLSLQACMASFVQHHESKLSQSTISDYKNAINNHLPRTTWPLVEDITIHHWLKHFDEYERPKTAKLMFKKVRAALRWCFERGMITRPSILDIRGQLIGEAETPGSRVLTIREVKDFLEYLELDGSDLVVKSCVRFIVYTGCRLTEARTIEWKDIDFDEAIWTMPREKSKTKDVIRRSLSSDVLSLLYDMKKLSTNGFVFEARRKDGELSRNAITGTIARVVKSLKVDKPDMEHFSTHDFRRTIATRLSENDIMPHVTEKILGHRLSGVMAVYNKR